MELYSFSGESVLINTSEPPRHWYNYLWNKHGYVSQISQIGHGRSYTIDNNANLCQINSEGCRYLYLRDDTTTASWRIGSGGGSSFRCEHHPAYSEVSGLYGGMKASWKLFVPKDDQCEIWTLHLRNTGDVAAYLSVFAVMSFELEGFKYPRYYEMYRFCETSYSDELKGVYIQSKHPNAPHDRYNAFLSCSKTPYAFDGDLTGFLGAEALVTKGDSSPAGQYISPRVISSGKDCANSETSNFMLGAALQNKLTIAPKQTIALNYIVGVTASKDEAMSLTNRIYKSGAPEQMLSDAIIFAAERYRMLTVTTPEPRLDRIFNTWLKKQTDFCVVGKKGVRDNLQVAVSMLCYDVPCAKAEILEVLRHQFRDGSAVLTWQPYDDTKYSDQPFWIIWAVIELVKETGDFSILDHVIDYQDGGSGSVMEHVKSAIRRLLTATGPNGLPLILTADWNDSLNITTDPEAESVMLAAQLCLALKEMSALCRKIGAISDAEDMENNYCILRSKINEAAWDGEWYVRAKSKHGDVGSKKSDGSKIFLNAQVWPVLAGIPDSERMKQVLDAIDSMEHSFGFPLNSPPYNEYSQNLGRISAMLPGLYENGGVYCHATGFKAYMDCVAGRADNALRALLSIFPDNPDNPVSISGAEPYVMTNCYGMHPKYYGKSYHSWITSTSAWVLMTICDGIFGLKRDYDGLRVVPQFPSGWNKAQITRKFRGTNYHITVERTDDAEKHGIWVDGNLIDSDLLPLLSGGGILEAVVRIPPYKGSNEPEKQIHKKGNKI